MIVTRYKSTDALLACAWFSCHCMQTSMMLLCMATQLMVPHAKLAQIVFIETRILTVLEIKSSVARLMLSSLRAMNSRSTLRYPS